MTPLPRRRRWSLVLLWLAGTSGATTWWATQPETSPTQVPVAAAAFALLLAASLAHTNPTPPRTTRAEPIGRRNKR